MTDYTNLIELTDYQIQVLEFVDWWVHNKKTPTPLKEIKIKMKSKGINDPTTIYSIKILVKKGYLRRNFNGGNAKVSFVQLRTI